MPSRSIGLCAIWVCINSSSSSSCLYRAIHFISNLTARPMRLNPGEVWSFTLGIKSSGVFLWNHHDLITFLGETRLNVCFFRPFVVDKWSLIASAFTHPRSTKRLIPASPTESTSASKNPVRDFCNGNLNKSVCMSVCSTQRFLTCFCCFSRTRQKNISGLIQALNLAWT